MHARQIKEVLGIREADYLALLGLLGDLVLDGSIRALPGQRYRTNLGPARETREGIVRVHPRGFGFVCCPGSTDDIYVQERSLGGAMHGDTVRAQVMTRSRRGLEGRIVEVLERANDRVQGVLRQVGNNAWLEVDDERIRGPVTLIGEVEGQDGDAAVVEITQHPLSADHHPEGRLIAALGPPGDADVETRKILLREEIEESFSQEVLEQVAQVSGDINASSIEQREDLRNLDFVTIDPADARDRDDAIWVRQLDAGFEAWVAIADVAAFVKPGTALDEVARERGFSIYLPDRAVPMLPSQLSSKLCSLEEGEDRLCMAVWMRFDEKGRLQQSRVCEAVIRSRAMLSYRQVADAMKWSKQVSAEHVQRMEQPISDQVEAADRLSKVLHRHRMRRGALELSTAEPRIILDPDSGKPVDVVRRAEDPGVKRAYRLIEELMIAANEAVAFWLEKRKTTALYRVHPPPNEEKLERLANFCESLDVAFAYDEATDPQRLGMFLQRAEQHPLAEIIGMLTLRSLAQASYDVVNVGHFGLASKAYVHFTSPIRRYPDLVVHRIVKQALRRVGEAGMDAVQCQAVALHCAKRERKVAEIEREVAAVYRCVTMKHRVGQRCVGTVTDIGFSSITATLMTPFVEVRVPEALLGREGYERSEDGLHMVAASSGDRISMGNRLLIEIESIDLTRRVITGVRLSKPSKMRKSKTRKKQPRSAGHYRHNHLKSKKKKSKR